MSWPTEVMETPGHEGHWEQKNRGTLWGSGLSGLGTLGLGPRDVGNWYRDSLGDTVTRASGTGRAEGHLQGRE